MSVMWLDERQNGSVDWSRRSEKIPGIIGPCGRSLSFLGESSFPNDDIAFRREGSIYKDIESSFHKEGEDQTDVSLLSRLCSIRLEDEINVSVEPYGAWGEFGDVASASDLINDSFDETRTSMANWTHEIYSELVDPLYNQDFGLWGNYSDSQFHSLDAFSEAILGSHRSSFDSNDPWDGASPVSPQTVLSGSQTHDHALQEQHGKSINDLVPDYSIPMMNSPCINLSDVWNDGIVSMNSRISRSPKAHYKSSMMPKFEPLTNVQGSIAEIAKDQYGCRYLQRILDEGKEEEREMIFNEILHHVSDLMVNPFGNYLVQKVLEVCTDGQRLKIVSVLANHPLELMEIALNMHGTRALQKLIEVLKNEEETELIMTALQSNFLNLVTDPNGNHVIQRCLRHFSYDQCTFIFEAAARYCMEIATHRHGCCILQQCIAHSTGYHKKKLLEEVSLNGLTLAQDAYGNYAVQYLLDTQQYSAFEMLKSKFKGNYARMSMQKFSSNVVEKCLRVFDDGGRKMIVSELLSVSSFDLLMQDPFANYVIQCALVVCKGQLRSSLADAVRARSALRGNPFCRRIFNLLKK